MICWLLFSNIFTVQMCLNPFMPSPLNWTLANSVDPDQYAVPDQGLHYSHLIQGFLYNKEIIIIKKN